MASHYREAGVDIDAATRAVDMMKAAVRATHTAAVLADVGSFGGLFALENLPAQPVLVASTDGVGTKVKLAAELGRWHGIGHDIVNHCVNDILVQNARPLFFLDYVATSKLVPEAVAAVVTGIAEACAAEGIIFVGPSATMLDSLGDKTTARGIAAKAGVPVLGGSSKPLASLDEAIALGDQLGYPVMMKAAMGGGGRGMRVVRGKNDLASAFEQAQREAGWHLHQEAFQLR